jgi:RNA-binding protein YhbY
MSIENRPNLHVVGLTTDIISSIMKRVRGKNKEIIKSKILERTREDISDFVENVNSETDSIARMYGKE